MLSFSLWSCSGDQEQAQADVSVDAELEAQILQVIRDNPQVLIDSVQAYQLSQQQAQQQTATDFQAQLTSNPEAVIGDSPTLGSEEFNVVLIEFSDFECPFCARASETLKTFIEQNADTVTLAYKHLPLVQIHPQAIAAAEASWAAQQQGKFWEYHDQLFENQGQFNEELYQRIAQDLGLDLEQFEADRQRARPAIDEDLTLAQSLGLNGTPFFILASTETGNVETFSGALDLQEYEAKLAAVITP
ncbi:DsbA family protein [Picosynechococcus sp. NKBG15041c]|uniref:DsbA family protein n=1 Tax=Picosynechococcus sp. NKBG15041c TaxID=1407650 RepID=UPI0004098573|nr:thioredoxin domain-containing protein [Picosynechococcus sp. NKBG15041c]